MRGNPDFDLDLQWGQEAEGEVMQLLQGGRIEVKRSSIAHRDGRFFVEYQCDKGATGKFEKSGICTSKADYWALVFDALDVIVLVPRRRLYQLTKAAYNSDEKNRQDAGKNGSCPTKGVLVPLLSEWLLWHLDET